MSRRRINRSMFLALGTMAAIYLGAVVEVAAQGYPSKTVRIVVPSSPGGGSDLVARTLAAPLAEMLGQPFIVENRVGSGGIVGTQQVAQSAPDGHTLLVTFDTFAINPFLFKNLQWDPIRDFTPIMQVCRYPQVLLVHPSLGVKSVKQFVALAKQKGAELNFGVRRSGFIKPPGLRIIQGSGRPRYRSRSLQGRRSGDAGLDLRAGAGDVLSSQWHDSAARKGRQAEHPRDQHSDSFAHAAGAPDNRRDLSRMGNAGVGGDARAGRYT